MHIKSYQGQTAKDLRDNLKKYPNDTDGRILYEGWRTLIEYQKSKSGFLGLEDSPDFNSWQSVNLFNHSTDNCYLQSKLVLFGGKN